MKDQVDNLAEKTGSPSRAALNGLLTPPERGDLQNYRSTGHIIDAANQLIRHNQDRMKIGQEIRLND